MNARERALLGFGIGLVMLELLILYPKQWLLGMAAFLSFLSFCLVMVNLQKWGRKRRDRRILKGIRRTLNIDRW